MPFFFIPAIVAAVTTCSMGPAVMIGAVANEGGSRFAWLGNGRFTGGVQLLS